MNSWHVHIEGQVQGVGFRPFVYSLAEAYGLKGWVNNTIDGVHIVFNADRQLASNFVETLVQKAPSQSKIIAINQRQIQYQFFDNFQIVHSTNEGKASLLLTPDFALCEDCRKDLLDPDNRRYGYPFITCTHCGPRFSIIHHFPYDRIHTEMEAFEMCPTCRQEYHTPSDRRYFSQTNSCSDCGVELTLYDANSIQLSKHAAEIIEKVTTYWKAGKIVAIKGIGGYLLTCDASNEKAVLELRKRKHRPSKPFALMFPRANLSSGHSIGKEVIKELKNEVAPIVLVDSEQIPGLLPHIAPGLNRVGIMLPYAPIYELLLQRFGQAIVATSANVSHSPIVYKEEKALNELSELADFIVSNNRKIVIPQDDSLVQFSFFKKHKIILRRSRGLAPTYINASLKWPETSILAMGAVLKSTFSFLHQNNTYISQYLGDLTHFDSQQNYQQTIEHFLQLFKTQPEIILRDEHAGYPSSQYGDQLASALKLPIQKIQHHQAHFGAIIGEHHLMHSDAPLLGVIWDGTGLGSDGQIWGGEFFKYEQYAFQRCQHFAYFDFILGDKMPKEPRISALSIAWNIKEAKDLLKEKFSPTEWRIYHKLLQREGGLQTSSVGRIFDAVAALLGIMNKQSYEGEAAMRLEAMASNYFKQYGFHFSSCYFSEIAFHNSIPTQFLLTQIILDLKKGKTPAFIAAKFHYSLVSLVKRVAKHLKIKQIAFSGGVFQNSLLVDLMLHYLDQDFDLYFHQQLAPNDENISFGQLVCYQIKKHKATFHKNKLNKHVFSDSR